MLSATKNATTLFIFQSLHERLRNRVQLIFSYIYQKIKSTFCTLLHNISKNPIIGDDLSNFSLSN